MTSTDDVHRLHREGFSIRAIAKRLGLTRMGLDD
jgi:IS30 family transposase